MAGNNPTEDIVYCFVCDHPGKSISEISKKLGVTNGRVENTLSKLKQQGLIEFKSETSTNIKKTTYPVNAWNLLPKQMKKQLKKIYRVNSLK